jgi:hypothetical protein
MTPLASALTKSASSLGWPIRLGPQSIALPEGTVLGDRLGKAHEMRVEGGKLKVALAPRSSAIYIARR